MFDLKKLLIGSQDVLAGSQYRPDTNVAFRVVTSEFFETKDGKPAIRVNLEILNGLNYREDRTTTIPHNIILFQDSEGGQRAINGQMRFFFGTETLEAIARTLDDMQHQRLSQDEAATACAEAYENGFAVSQGRVIQGELRQNGSFVNPWINYQLPVYQNLKQYKQATAK